MSKETEVSWSFCPLNWEHSSQQPEKGPSALLVSAGVSTFFWGHYLFIRK
jgi:hypothetical protein